MIDPDTGEFRVSGNEGVPDIMRMLAHKTPADPPGERTTIEQYCAWVQPAATLFAYVLRRLQDEKSDRESLRTGDLDRLVTANKSRAAEITELAADAKTQREAVARLELGQATEAANLAEDIRSLREAVRGILQRLDQYEPVKAADDVVVEAPEGTRAWSDIDDADDTPRFSMEEVRALLRAAVGAQ